MKPNRIPQAALTAFVFIATLVVLLVYLQQNAVPDPDPQALALPSPITETAAAAPSPFPTSPTPTMTAQAAAAETATPAPPRKGLESGFFSGLPCSHPCWQNLTPGLSTQGDVEKFLEGLDPQEWPTKLVFHEETGCTWTSVRDQPGVYVKAAFELYYSSETLFFIEFFPSTDPALQDINLDAVVDHLGEPEYMMSVLGVSFDSSHYVLEVYYPSRGVAFILDPDQNRRGLVEPTTPITSIQYFSPGDMKNYFIQREACFIGIEDAAHNADIYIPWKIRPWTGFGEVEVIITR